MDDVDAEYRHIQMDDGPRLAPLRLDAMFTRAMKWDSSASSSSSSGTPALLPASCDRSSDLPRMRIRREVLPLTTPGMVESPLGAVFDYPELLPIVLANFEHPKELAVLARVNKAWCGMVRKKLYHTVWVRPWEKNCHVKLVRLFETLHQGPELCRLVKRLDVRFFPLAASGGERLDLDDQVQTAFKHMTNLEHLVWTRDKSLSPLLVEQMVQLEHLRSLEISGHSHRYYPPHLLGQLRNLEDLRIMMPDSTLRDHLVQIVKELSERRQGGLQGLGLICRSSPLIDDDLVRAMAKYMTKLRRLTLWGCSRLTRKGLYDLLRETNALEDLSLDAFTNSQLLELSHAPGLAGLKSFSLSITCPTRVFLELSDLPSLPPLLELQALHLTLSGGRKFIPQGGLQKLQSHIDFGTLRKLSLISIVIGQMTLSEIIAASPNLHELYITVNGKKVISDSLTQLAQAGSLRILHVNAPENWAPTEDDMVEWAKVMPHLEQIGTGNRVYEVWRRARADCDEEGQEEEEAGEGEVELTRWSRTTIPGYFQIWRG